MSLENENVRAVYSGNGVTTEFAITQALQDKEQLRVFLITIADGSISELSLGSGYELLPNELNPAFVEISPAPSSAYQVLILRETPNTQPGELTNIETFKAAGFEELLNWIVMQVQELKDKLDRSPQLSNSQVDAFDTTLPPGGTAGQVLALNATLDGFEWVDKD